MNWLLIIAILITISLIRLTKYSVKNTDQEMITRIYVLLEYLDILFKMNGVEYIISSGTLLGSVRHSGMIPWDDDADIIVLNKSPKEITDLINKYTKISNIRSREHETKNIVLCEFEGYLGVIDIFFTEKEIVNNKVKYTYAFPYNIKYPKEWFYEDEIYPIKEYTFGELKLKGPNNSSKFLDRVYPEWKTKIVKWNHKYKKEEEIYTTNFQEVALPEFN
jgi:phosphorylcholine metabolism protein LicD